VAVITFKRDIRIYCAVHCFVVDCKTYSVFFCFIRDGQRQCRDCCISFHWIPSEFFSFRIDYLIFSWFVLIDILTYFFPGCS
jgi:hypothetical protein